MIKEESIRDLLHKQKLVKSRNRDIAKLLKTARFIKVNCPACGSSEYKSAFSKDGFKFTKCPKCGTLFVNPRPSEDDLKEYYTKADMPRIFAMMVKNKEKVRKKLIYADRANYVALTAKKYFPKRQSVSVMDIGGGTGGFLEVLRGLKPRWKYASVEPETASADSLRAKGFDVINKMIEDIEESKISKANIILNFELIEHIFDPCKFMKKVYKILSPDGLFILTTPNYNGFDFLCIGEGYKNIGVPNHLNYFNPDSIRKLLGRADFRVLDICTPGRMDADLARNYYSESKNTGNRFLDFLLFATDEAVLDKFQEFLSKNMLSGHMLVTAKKL